MNTKRKAVQANERRVLTPTERQGLKDKLAAQIEDRTEDDNHFVEGSGDPTEKAMEKRIEKVLIDGDLDSIGKHETLKLERRARELKEAMQSKMIPRKAMQYRPGVDGYLFQKAANDMAMNEMSPAFDVLAREYKNIMRQLYPGSPEMSNLDTIRPD